MSFTNLLKTMAVVIAFASLTACNVDLDNNSNAHSKPRGNPGGMAPGDPGTGGGSSGGGGGSGGGGSGSVTTYTLGGTVTGLAGTGLIIRNGAVDLPITANGGFTFAPALANGTTYSVSVVAQPTGPAQDCVVTQSAGQINSSNVTQVTVTCTTKPLTVLSSTPSFGAIDVEHDVMPVLEFSAPIDPDSIGDEILFADDIGPLATRLTLVSGNRIKVEPQHALRGRILYTISVTSGLRGTSGETLTEPVSIQFRSVDGQWKSPVAVEDTDGNAAEAHIRMDTKGNAFAAWARFTAQQLTTDTVTSRYIAGTGWESPIHHLETSVSQPANEPTIAVDTFGNALALWYQKDGTSAYERLMSQDYFLRANAWGSGVRVDPTAADGFRPHQFQVAFDSNDIAHVIWLQTGATNQLWTNRYTFGNGWGTPELLEPGTDQLVSEHRLAVSRNGNAFVVWTQFDGTAFTIWSRRYTTADGWTTGEQISLDQDGEASTPAVASDAQGNALVVWQQAKDPDNLLIWARRYSVDGGWGTPQRLTESAGNNFSAQVATNARGEGMAVWIHNDSAQKLIRASHFSPEGGWSAPAILVEAAQGGLDSAQVVIDPKGDALALWRQPVGGRFSLWGNRYRDGIGWSTAQLLENDDTGNAEDPDLAVSDDGTAMAIWTQFDGTRFNLWSARFE
jgi:hypothetical protein